jgi:hypothetical protein
MANPRGDRALVLAAGVSLIALRLVGTYLRFLVHRRRGVATFRETLLGGGIPREQANALIRVYEEASSIRRIVRGVTRTVR